jgi:hypothetical protein
MWTSTPTLSFTMLIPIFYRCRIKGIHRRHRRHVDISWAALILLRLDLYHRFM